MAIIGPANIQQIFQMSPQAEKLQQATQNQPSTVAQQLSQERIDQDELKRNQVQQPENPNASNPSDPDGKGKRGRLRIRRKSQETPQTEAVTEESSRIAENNHGRKIDVVI